MSYYIKKKLLSIIVILTFLTGCSDNAGITSSYDKMNYREIAYESLSDQEKETITDWRQAEVQQGKYEPMNGAHTIFINRELRLYFFLTNPDKILRAYHKLIAVSFNTTDDSLLGPIIVIIDPASEKMIGFVGRL